jgi:peptidoglycan/LPS O-acetylase OafA/YrhL
MAFWIMKNKNVKYATYLGGVGFIVVFILYVLINDFTHTFSITSIQCYCLNETVLPVSVALIIYGIIEENSFLKKILQCRVIVILGKSSYTLYLLHWGMTSYLIHRFVNDNYVVDILLSFAISILLWYFIEEPSNRFIKRFRRR